MGQIVQKLNHIIPDFESLADVDPKGEIWNKNRKIAESVERMYKWAPKDRPDLKRLGERCAECTEILEYGYKPDDNGELHFKLKSARFCHVRHCPICQWRRSLVWKGRFMKALPSIVEAYPGAKWIHLTLTVKNCEATKLRETLKTINKGFIRMSQLKAWPGKGWVKAIEVTKGEDGSAHPHVHCLLMVNKTYFNGGQYLSQATWSEMWKRSARLDYEPMIHVQRVKLAKKREEAMRAELGEEFSEDQISKMALMKAVAETFKYGVKPTDMVSNKEWFYTITDELHKARSISIGGVLRAFMKQEEPETDSELVEGCNNEMGINPGGRFFLWNPDGSKQYKRRKKPHGGQ